MPEYYKKLTDQELLVIYCNKDDKQALAILFKRYYHLVFGVAMKYLQEQELAKDLTMQVFEKLITELKKHQIDYFKSWLYRVAQNACLMELRKKNSNTKPLEESILRSMENDAETHHIVEKERLLVSMENELANLPPEQQQCITLFYLERKSYNDICQLTGFTFKEVKSYIQNGKRNLKIKLQTG